MNVKVDVDEASTFLRPWHLAVNTSSHLRVAVKIMLWWWSCDYMSFRERHECIVTCLFDSLMLHTCFLYIFRYTHTYIYILVYIYTYIYTCIFLFQSSYVYSPLSHLRAVIFIPFKICWGADSPSHGGTSPPPVTFPMANLDRWASLKRWFWQKNKVLS